MPPPHTRKRRRRRSVNLTGGVAAMSARGTDVAVSVARREVENLIFRGELASNLLESMAADHQWASLLETESQLCDEL